MTFLDDMRWLSILDGIMRSETLGTLETIKRLGQKNAWDSWDARNDGTLGTKKRWDSWDSGTVRRSRPNRPLSRDVATQAKWNLRFTVIRKGKRSRRLLALSVFIFFHLWFLFRSSRFQVRKSRKYAIKQGCDKYFCAS